MAFGPSQGDSTAGTPVAPGSPGGINIDPLTELDCSTMALDEVIKGDGAGGCVIGAVPASTPAAHASSHENGGADEINVAGLSGELADEQPPKTHTHPTSDVVSGTFADARIAESNVTQHEGAIDHDALTGFEIGEHRVINDAGTSTIETWSASKLDSEFSAVVAGIDIKASVDTTTFGEGDTTLSGEQTLAGLLTSASRVLVVEQTSPAENGIYVTAAGAWARASDADEDAEVTNGNLTHVLNSGSDEDKNKYLLATADPITVGTTGQNWERHLNIEFGDSAGQAVEGTNARVPSQDENDALAGTDGTPSTANKFVTNSDSRNSDSRTPVQATESIVGGGELATQAEVDTGTDDTRIVTPLKLTTFSGLGKLKQQEVSETTSVVNCNVAIPEDDTIPQITEGVEVLTRTITPKSLSNRLVLRFRCSGSVDSTHSVVVALFRDSIANALAVDHQGARNQSELNPQDLQLEHFLPVPSLSLQTYRIRVGLTGSGSFFVNGNSSGTRNFGGVSRATLIVEEVAP